MSNGKAKGNSFERNIAVSLSLWATKDADDNIFWRSTNSGGRATSRSKLGKKTANSYGDIAALVPLGEDFLRAVNIEIKRGYNSLSLSDLFDKPKESKKTGYAAWIEKAQKEHQESGSFSWILIHKRDRRIPIVLMPEKLSDRMEDYEINLPIMMTVFHYGRYAVSTLEDWFTYVDPDVFRRIGRDEGS